MNVRNFRIAGPRKDKVDRAKIDHELYHFHYKTRLKKMKIMKTITCKLNKN